MSIKLEKGLYKKCGHPRGQKCTLKNCDAIREYLHTKYPSSKCNHKPKKSTVYPDGRTPEKAENIFVKCLAEERADRELVRIEVTRRMEDEKKEGILHQFEAIYYTLVYQQK